MQYCSPGAWVGVPGHWRPCDVPATGLRPQSCNVGTETGRQVLSWLQPEWRRWERAASLTALRSTCDTFICANVAGRHRCPRLTEAVTAQRAGSVPDSSTQAGLGRGLNAQALLLLWCPHGVLHLPYVRDSGTLGGHRHGRNKVDETEPERGLRWGELPQKGEGVPGETRSMESGVCCAVHGERPCCEVAMGYTQAHLEAM